jgi:hypothetical protein
MGTAPPLSLLRVAKLSPQGVVGFFPSDHHSTDLGEPQRVVSTLQSNQFYHRTAGLCSPST